jgi:hypothetical protein
VVLDAYGRRYSRPRAPQSRRRAPGFVRKLHRQGHGVAINLPREALDHLGAALGEHVYVALSDDGTVKLAPVERLNRAADPLITTAERLGRAETLIRTLRRKLSGAWLAGYNTGFCYGMLHSLGNALTGPQRHRPSVVLAHPETPAVGTRDPR